MINMTHFQVLLVESRLIGRTLLEYKDDIPYFHFAANDIVATIGS